MRVAITGSSGVVGSALVAALRSDGHDVIRLVRREAIATDEVQWHPERGGRIEGVLLDALTGLDAAINLAGAGIGEHRWTSSFKRTLLTSRVDATTALVAVLSALDPIPSVLVSGSAYGYYGDTGPHAADEEGVQGSTFLAEVAGAWELAAAPAAGVGIRVAHPRSALVVSKRGGAFATMRQVIERGLGGPLGNGRQWWSFISLADEVRAICYLLNTAEAVGPYNLAAPYPCTNAEAIEAFGRLLGKPVRVPAPAFAVRAVLGELADEVLGDRRVVPTRLLAEGFAFHHPTIEQALATLVE